MEFAEPGRGPVTLLHFTPLCTDDFVPTSYGCMDTYSSPAATGCGGDMPTGPLAVSTAELLDTGTAQMNCSLPYSYVGTNSCEVYNGLAMDQNPPYCESVPQGPPPYNAAEFGVLVSDMSSVGPPPVRLPRLEPPMTIDTTISTNDNYSSSPGSRGSSFYTGPHSHSTPHSPMNLGDQCQRKQIAGFNKTYTYPKRTPKSSSRNMIMRSSSPMFPDQSTPLSNLQRQPSVSSITSVWSADQISTYSISTNSTSNCESAANSPSVNSINSPRFEFALANNPSPQSSTTVESRCGSRSCLEVEVPAKYSRRISDIDKKILKLQADRSKLLEKVYQSDVGLAEDSRGPDGMHAWLFNEKMPMGRAHLYIFPLGIHELDDPLYDEASKLLREVGGLYLDLQTSISIMRRICCKGMFIPAEISTCFAYINSLLHEHRNLKLSNVDGVYSVTLESDQVTSEEILPTEFTEALTAANQVLKCAQQITLSHSSVLVQLQKLRQIAVGKLETWNTTYQKLVEIVDREKRTQIKAILEGNCTTMASAERVWSQYYQAATQTIKTITECIHPTLAI